MYITVIASNEVCMLTVDVVVLGILACTVVVARAPTTAISSIVVDATTVKFSKVSGWLLTWLHSPFVIGPRTFTVTLSGTTIRLDISVPMLRLPRKHVYCA